jgi:GTPase SAR1 family protein
LKKKVLLASGYKRFDAFIKEELQDLYDFYSINQYSNTNQYSAEVLIKHLKEDNIPILLIGEKLPTVRPLIEEIRDIIAEIPKLTIIVYAKGEKQKDDKFLNDLLNIGIRRFSFMVMKLLEKQF